MLNCNRAITLCVFLDIDCWLALVTDSSDNGESVGGEAPVGPLSSVL